eukprot:scaffold358168_cov24-Prasinocladus_malaysianus.AAC.1
MGTRTRKNRVYAAVRVPVPVVGCLLIVRARVQCFVHSNPTTARDRRWQFVVVVCTRNHTSRTYEYRVCNTTRTSTLILDTMTRTLVDTMTAQA